MSAVINRKLINNLRRSSVGLSINVIKPSNVPDGTKLPVLFVRYHSFTICNLLKHPTNVRMNNSGSTVAPLNLGPHPCIRETQS